FFGEQNPETHSFMRKRVSHLYSMSSIMGAQDKIQVVLDSLWEKFDRFAKEGEEINLSKWAFYFTYDVVGTITWSEPLGMIREEKDVGNYIRLMHEAFYWICNLGYLPGGSAWITHPLTARIAPLFGSSMHLSATPFQRATFQKVMTRMKAGPVKDGQAKDMLDHFLGLKDQEGKPLTLAGIMPEVGNPMAAGADTTSIGIRAVLAPVLRSEKHYKRLQDEIDQARKHASLGDGEVLRFDVLSALPFLSACIKEGGRMHSSIVYNLPRNVPKGGVTFDQYFIPETATLSYSPLAQNRCKAIFGEDADQWRPERWIEGEGSSEEELRNMNKYLATFGYGSRACIGRNLAMFEMYNFIGQILSRYDVELLDKDKPLKIRSSWISDLENMRIRLKKRSSTAGL
ncbi:cytochrome P450, partial [Cadophora sp. DSE1049]